MKHWIRLLCLPLLAIAASMVSAQNVTEISTVQQLKDFRDAVNAGNNYAGQTVKLAADLDLNGETWIPIGQEGTNVANSNKLVKKVPMLPIATSLREPLMAADVSSPTL